MNSFTTPNSKNIIATLCIVTIGWNKQERLENSSKFNSRNKVEEISLNMLKQNTKTKKLKRFEPKQQKPLKTTYF